MFFDITKEESLALAKDLDRELPVQFFADTEPIFKSICENADFDMKSERYYWLNLLRQENKEFLLSAKEMHLEYIFQMLEWNDGKVGSFVEEVSQRWKEWEKNEGYRIEYKEESQKANAQTNEKLEKYYRFVKKQGEKYGNWSFDDKSFLFLKLSGLESYEANLCMTDYVIKLGQQEGKSKETKGLISHAVSLQKYERTEGEGNWLYPSITMDWLQLCFMNWRCKEKIQETTNDLLKLLYQYVLETTKNQERTYESFQIHEIFEEILEGNTQQLDATDWLKVYNMEV